MRGASRAHVERAYASAHEIRAKLKAGWSVRRLKAREELVRVFEFDPDCKLSAERSREERRWAERQRQAACGRVGALSWI